MRLLHTFAVALLLLSRPLAQAQTGADEAAIRAVLAKETAAWNRFDAAGVVATYTDDVVWQNPFGVRIHGGAQMLQFLQDLLARPGYRAGVSTVPATILDLRLTSPTTAAVWSDERITGLVNDVSGHPMEPRHSFYLRVLVKQHGAWKTADMMVMDTIHLK